MTGIEHFTPVVAEHYADILTQLSKAGTLIPQNDIAVAATARTLAFGRPRTVMSTSSPPATRSTNSLSSALASRSVAII